MEQVSTQQSGGSLYLPAKAATVKNMQSELETIERHTAFSGLPFRHRRKLAMLEEEKLSIPKSTTTSPRLPLTLKLLLPSSKPGETAPHPESPARADDHPSESSPTHPTAADNEKLIESLFNMLDQMSAELRQIKEDLKAAPDAEVSPTTNVARPRAARSSRSAPKTPSKAKASARQNVSRKSAAKKANAKGGVPEQGAQENEASKDNAIGAASEEVPRGDRKRAPARSKANRKARS